MKKGEFKSRIEYITHKGRRIMHIDHTALEELPDLEQTRAFFAQARQEVDAQPVGSVRLLTSMSSRMRFNAEIAALEREFAQANTPYMKRSAVVGATAAMKAIMATLRFFTGRDIRAFDTTAEALDWLAE
jgi:hypothetical protein